MTDYLSETQGNYYTQRWYIARRDQGSVSLCDYYPPTDDNSILNGDHWYRINTSDPNFYPNSTQREQILANSENHAGWSRSRVQQLNAQSDGFTYTMNYWMSSYIISRGGKQTKKPTPTRYTLPRAGTTWKRCMRMSSTPTAWT